MIKRTMKKPVTKVLRSLTCYLYKSLTLTTSADSDASVDEMEDVVLNDMELGLNLGNTFALDL
jgi:hypothetical protein